MGAKWTTRTLFERFHKGLLAQIRESGKGDFRLDFEFPNPKTTTRGSTGRLWPLATSKTTARRCGTQPDTTPHHSGHGAFRFPCPKNVGVRVPLLALLGIARDFPPGRRRQERAPAGLDVLAAY